MNGPVAGVIAVLGRVLLSAIFLMSAVNHALNYSGTVGYMAAEGVPMPSVLLAIGLVFMIVGGLSLLLGVYGQWGAMLLILFLILANFFFHDFWNVPEEQVQNQMIHFMKNTAIMGALLLIVAVGTGPWSLTQSKSAAP